MEGKKTPDPPDPKELGIDLLGEGDKAPVLKSLPPRPAPQTPHHQYQLRYDFLSPVKFKSPGVPANPKKRREWEQARKEQEADQLSRSGFGRGNQKGTGQQKTPPPTSQGVPSIHPNMQQVPLSPGPGSAQANESPGYEQPQIQRPPFFFEDKYATLIVKGNFMTLAARPQHVELGEWLAHQVVEQYRVLSGVLVVITTNDDRTGTTICNPDCCPSMSAAGHTYTWLDSNKKPIRIPAIQYIQLVQRWINGKISDPNLFPTDTTFSNPSSYASGGMSAPAGSASGNAPPRDSSGHDWLGKPSGFPESFESDIRSIYRQMMRCYAHLYHGHWINPFWHLNMTKELNTCFVHFVNVGKLYGLIADRDLEPMQPLVDLWIGKGLLPKPQPTQQTPAASAPSTQQQEGASEQGQLSAPQGQ